MRVSTMRKGLVALGALAVLVLMLVAALPLVASTQIVRDRIAHELSIWSGYRVSLGAAPELVVWPNFKARLNRVAFHEWDGRGAPPVLEVERLEVTMSALAALRGNVVLSGASMHRPLLRLSTQDAALRLPAAPGGGRMSRAIDAARAVVASNPANPDRGALPADAFGTVEFVDGRIALADGGEADLVSDLSGRIAWPSLNRQASLTATATWRGEAVSVEGSSAQPLMLLARAGAPVKATLRSDLVSASFEGTADLSDAAYLDGQASFSSPALRRMLDWFGAEIAPGAAIGAVSVTSRLQGTVRRLRLDQAALMLDGNAGHGVLDVSLANEVPAISGTLAFDRLDLLSFLAAFAPAVSGEGDLDDPIDTSFSEQLSLDVRLSARGATLGAVALSDVAAAAQVKGGLAAFDISDATGFDGTLQAALRIDTAEGGRTVEMRLMAEDVDAFALAKAAGAERLLPQGRANLSAVLKGAGDDWNTVIRNAEGTVSASMGQGALAGFDLSRFRERWAAGGFFALSDVSGGTLPFRGLTFKAMVAGGVARIDQAEIQLEGQVASLAGIIPYFGRALALSGHFAPLEVDGTGGEAGTAFFIGGAWDAPFVVQAQPVDVYE